MKLCKCGCGKEIKRQFHHKYYGTPDFIWGHHVKTEDGRERMRKMHLGTKLSNKTREKMSEASKGIPKSREHIKNQVATRRGKPGMSSEVARRVSLLGKLKQKKFNTKPELKAKDILDKLKIEYIHPYPVWNIEHKYPADFYIPETNTILEVDGKYWHNYPKGNERDHIRNKELLEKNYKIIRVWEDEIDSIPKLLGR